MTVLARPADLFDREQDWVDLSTFATRSTSGLRVGVISGRRRQGKSFLLRRLSNATDGLYHQAQELERAQALARFADDVARRRRLPQGAIRFENWDVALRTALNYPLRGEGLNGVVTTGPSLLVLDELPYLLANSPEIPSVLQEIVDEADERAFPSAGVIVCGSALSVMTELLSGSKPLRGRAQLDMTIGPFPFRLAADYWGITDPEVAFHVDAVLGGTAGYKALIEQTPPATREDLRDWLAGSVLNPAHALFNEKEHLLREDPRITEKQVFNSILAAVAGGAHTQAKIGRLLGRDANQLRHPLEILVKTGFLRRYDDMLVSKRPTYYVADPIVRFSEVVVEPYRVLLEERDVDTAWESADEGFRSRILGPHFEQMCRDWVGSAPVERWPEPIGEVGSTVINDSQKKSQHELDVLALRRGDRRGAANAKIVLLGEARSGERERTVADLQRLRRIKEVLEGRGANVAAAHLAVFGRGGFERELMRAAKADPTVHLVDLAELYRWPIAQHASNQE